MKSYSRTHLADRELLQSLAASAGDERSALADLLADVAEVDARRLYLPAAHPSMHSYCVHELRLSEDEAYKRIQAARAGREHPVIFEMVADGRLSLTAVWLVAPHLTAENAQELLAAAASKTIKAVRALLAERFPRSEVLPMVAIAEPAGHPLDQATSDRTQAVANPAADELVSKPVEARPTARPLSSQSVELHLSVSRETYETLLYAQALASHQIPARDMPAAFDRAVGAWVRELEKSRLAATARPRKGRTASDTRSIPVTVRRAVWERDGGQCAYVSESGQRCGAREKLEFDHIQPLGRGGQATVEGMRLLCRAHNQFEAERVYGADFMARKREEARAARAAATAARRREPAQPQALSPHVEEVIPWLKGLGFRAEEARNAAALCEAMPDAPVAERVKLALRYFARPRANRAASGAA